MKIHPVGAEMLHADGQTSMTKVTFAFRNSVNAPKCYILRFCRMTHICVLRKTHGRHTLRRLLYDIQSVLA
jgi:hypothetical protein